MSFPHLTASSMATPIPTLPAITTLPSITNLISTTTLPAITTLTNTAPPSAVSTTTAPPTATTTSATSTSPSPLPPPAVEPTATFHRFRDLPAELRRIIWSLCIPARRVIELNTPRPGRHYAPSIVCR